MDVCNCFTHVKHVLSVVEQEYEGHHFSFTTFVSECIKCKGQYFTDNQADEILRLSRHAYERLK